ncbi:uncharacterized protein LOC118793460 [Megalops cyprinoides]|uniref:uncharacterized protein LOC118793460 n=1 Tax=Megalops cyprinoides TaxID=118141 RepID=UPI001863F847|nr:uncharacterized protein LOC118793460 [Megalops cyprinoides]
MEIEQEEGGMGDRFVRGRSYRRLQGMLRKANQASFRTKKVMGTVAVSDDTPEEEHPPHFNETHHVLKIPPPVPPKPKILQTPPPVPPKPDIFQIAPPVLPKPDIFQTPPPVLPKTDIFQTIPSDFKSDLFQTTPPILPKTDLFQTTPSDPKSDLFQTTPSDPKSDLFQIMPSDPKSDLFQTTPSDPKSDLFQIMPSDFKSDLFQTTPSDPKSDLFQTTPTVLPKSDLFQTTPTVFPESDLFQTTPTVFPESDLFQTTPTVPPKSDLFQTTPTVLPEPDIFQIMPSDFKSDLFQTTPTVPPKCDLFQTTPTVLPKSDVFQIMPSDPKSDLFQTTPSDPKSDLFQIMPSDFKSDLFQTTPSDPKSDLFQTTPPVLPKHDIFQTTPSDPEEDIFQTLPSDPKKDIFQTLPSDMKQDIEPWTAEDYPVYENILLIGEEKCVEDWPENSPELDPDWKPSGRLRLRRESLRVQSEMQNHCREEDVQHDGRETHWKSKRGRRFSLQFIPRRDSKERSGDECSEKGADLFRGREGDDEEQDGGEDCRSQQKRGKKFKISFLTPRDPKERSGDECSEKGADLFRGREGDDEEQDGGEDCRSQQKRGKKFKISFLTPRDPKGQEELMEDPPGATCNNYHLSEAAEAEWFSSQRDEWLMKGAEAEETTGVEEGDTDSLMEWWNTVEQWDELPSDDEKLPEEEEVKAFTVMAEKVQKGIFVFNKLFVEQAEGLWQHVIDLNAIADDINNFHKKAKIASITGGTTTAVGGVTAIAGLALAPVTMGASLIITAVGIGVATAGGLTSASATISDTVNNSHDRKKVEKILEDYQAKMADVSKCLRFIRQGMEKLQEYNLLKLSPAHCQDRLISRAVQMGSEAGGTVDRALHIAGQAGSVLAGLCHRMDSYFVGKDLRELKKGCKTEFAAKIREVAEQLHEGLVELNSIREELQEAVYI